MVEVLKWLTYTVAMSAVGIAVLWAFWTRTSAGVGEQVRKLTPPEGVRLDAASRHAIFEELYERRRTGFHASIVVYVVLIIATHPMYLPDRLSDSAHSVAWGVALFSGYALGEVYAATRAAREPRTTHRVATLSPRSAATYLSPLERFAQCALLALLAVGAVALTVEAIAGDEPTWAMYAMVVCWIWLIAAVAAVTAQRWVLAQPPPLDGDRSLIVREYVTAYAMQQLHKAIWISGGLAYITAVSAALGPMPTGAELLAGYAPIALAFAAVLGYRHWRQVPDPVWHFARTETSAA
ncbi:hypothetical protein MU582_05100 [Nocardioidaceae bacterium SCSIO 66511]|nr:hypothetical protein MU582_05100 [Nocardioidaceae bacterium SCSIO 66511]